MKFTIEAAALAAAMARVGLAAPRDKAIPILSNTLVRAENGAVELTATDLDRAVTERVPAMIEVPGTVTVPASIFAGVASNVAAGSQIAAKLDGDRLHVRGGRAQWKLPTLPPEDFSSLESGDLPHRFTIPAADLRCLIAKTEWAINDEESRYYLCGVYLHVVDGKLRAVATNGSMLSRYDAIELPPGLDFPGIIIPGKTIALLKRLLAGRDEEASVELSPAKIMITIGPIKLTSKLIDGTFPDYARVIPNHTKEMRVAAADIRDALTRVSLVTDPARPGIKIEIDSGTATLSTSSRGEDKGSASEQLDVQFRGDAIEFGLNPRFAKDILANYTNGAEVRMLFNSPGEAVLLADGPAVFVLMPLRV